MIFIIYKADILLYFLFSFLIVLAKIFISPLSFRIKFIIILIVVLFPAPFGPTNPIIYPRGNVKLIFLLQNLHSFYIRFNSNISYSPHINTQSSAVILQVKAVTLYFHLQSLPLYFPIDEAFVLLIVHYFYVKHKSLPSNSFYISFFLKLLVRTLRSNYTNL